MKFLRLFLFFTLNLSVATSWSFLELPRSLDKSDRIRALQILGFGSAAKVLDNPYPLGGYTGVEVGLSSEFIPVEDLSSLGLKTTEKGELNYYTLTMAKGLYYNIDTHVYFTPFRQSEDVQAYGGQLRWGFYESDYFPLSITAIVSAGGANFSNLINVNTLGGDLVATVNMDNIAIYFGYGQCRAIGKFIGGTGGITDSQSTVEEDLVEGHSIFGLNVDIAKMFFAFQIDRYTDSNYSGKIGFRF